MNIPKIIGISVIIIFGFISLIALWKGSHEKPKETIIETLITTEPIQEKPSPKEIPYANLINELFSTTEPKLPIVETITYHKMVPWLPGRAAWIVDYANHYSTSRYFISRCLAKKADYFFENYKEGDRFNIFKKNISFYLLVDISRCKLLLYYIDNNEKVLIKTYECGLGRKAPSPSGSLTPLGKYSLGKNTAIYKPGMTGYFNHKKTELIRIFGTRWIPFDKELSNCTEPAKGFGLHGAPWTEDENHKLVEQKTLGSYESDGCIRLKSSDIEEIFAIIVSRPSTIEIVKDFETKL